LDTPFIDSENDSGLSLLQSKQRTDSQNHSQPAFKLPPKFELTLLQSQQYRRLHELFFERKATLHPKL
jgi:hypothetical protein